MWRRLPPLLVCALLAGCVTPLKKAVQNRDLAGVEKALAAGAPVDYSSGLELRATALELAVGEDELEIARRLLDAGANPNFHYDGAWPRPTPMELAVRMGRPDMVALLRSHGGRGPLLAGAAAPAATAPVAPPPAAAAPAAAPLVDPVYREAPRPDDFAVVVGVEKYPHLPPASYAERDADAVAEHFEALGVPERNLVRLIGPDASFTAIKKYVETWLPENVRPDSRVYFYFSGHGAPEISSGEAYLVPWDGDPAFLPDTAYPLKRLYAKLNALPARRVVVVLDSCFSGAGGRSVVAEGTRPLVAKLREDIPDSAKLSIVTAASADQITGALKPREHGLFTYYFLDSLNAAAAGGPATLESVYARLKPLVEDAARRQNRSQTPALFTSRDLKLLRR